jgi:hypothetical protein
MRLCICFQQNITDARSQNMRFARAWSSQYQHRPFGVYHGVLLYFVELLKPNQKLLVICLNRIDHKNCDEMKKN